MAKPHFFGWNFCITGGTKGISYLLGEDRDLVVFDGTP